MGALILLQEGGASAAAADWGATLLPSTPARLRRDVAVAAALAGVDEAADALARAGAAGARTAAARLAGAAAILDAAGVVEGGAAGGGGGGPAAAACPPGLRSGIEASLADIGPRAAVDTLAATPPEAPERRVAVDALARAAARAGAAGPDPARRFGAGLLAAAWPRLTPGEQASILDAAPASVLGPAGVDPAAAAGARVVAAVAAGQPAGVAAAERSLAASVAAAGARPAPSTRVAAATCRLLLGDPAGAADALGLGASPPADARISEFVAARSTTPSDPLPGMCALAEEWLRGAARGAAGCQGLDLSLSTWFGRPGVEARLAAAEGAAGLAESARAAAGELAGRLDALLGRAVGGVRARVVAAAAAAPRAPGVEREAGAGAGEAAKAAAPAAGVPHPRPTAVVAAVARAAEAALPPPAPTTPLDAVRGETVGALQARLLAAAAAAGEPGAWADAPLPADAIVPVSGEAPLWAVEAPKAAPGWRGAVQRAVRRAAAPVALVLAAGVAGALAAPGVRARAGAALAGWGAGSHVALPGAASPAPPLSPADALHLFNRFQAAKAAACGRAHAVAALEAVSGGKLLAEETARAATLAADGWAIEYATRRPRIIAPVEALNTPKKGGGAARFTVRAAEAATLRDGTGGTVDRVEWADFTAVVTAERVGGGGGWKLTEVREVE